MVPQSVVITRPYLQAAALADEVSALGFVPICSPLLHIKAQPDLAQQLSALKSTPVDIVLFVSKASVDALQAQPCLDWLRSCCLVAVGTQTAYQVANILAISQQQVFYPKCGSGIKAVMDLPLFKSAAIQKKHLVVFNGGNNESTDSGDFWQIELKQRGIASIRYVQSYQRIWAEKLMPELYPPRSILAWVISSSGSAKKLGQLANASLKPAGTYLTHHIEVARVLQDWGAERIELLDVKSQSFNQAVLQWLSRLSPQFVLP